MAKLKNYKVTANYEDYVKVSEAAKRKPISESEWVAEQGGDEVIQSVHVGVSSKPESPYTVTEVSDKEIGGLVEQVNAYNAAKKVESDAWLVDQEKKRAGKASV